MPASASGATSCVSEESCSGTSARPVVRTKGAIPPSTARPMNELSVHRWSSPRRHARQTPQVIIGCRTTLLPTSTPRTAFPFWATTPATSWPSVKGRGGGKTPASAPWKACRSVRQTPAPSTRTRTSSSPCSSGSGTSATTGMRPYCSRRTASMVPPQAVIGAGFGRRTAGAGQGMAGGVAAGGRVRGGARRGGVGEGGGGGGGRAGGGGGGGGGRGGGGGGPAPRGGPGPGGGRGGPGAPPAGG